MLSTFLLLFSLRVWERRFSLFLSPLFSWQEPLDRHPSLDHLLLSHFNIHSSHHWIEENSFLLSFQSSLTRDILHLFWVILKTVGIQVDTHTSEEHAVLQEKGRNRGRQKQDRDRTDGKSPKQFSSVSLHKKAISIVLKNASEKREAFD